MGERKERDFPSHMHSSHVFTLLLSNCGYLIFQKPVLCTPVVQSNIITILYSVRPWCLVVFMLIMKYVGNVHFFKVSWTVDVYFFHFVSKNTKNWQDPCCKFLHVWFPMKCNYFFHIQITTLFFFLLLKISVQNINIHAFVKQWRRANGGHILDRLRVRQRTSTKIKTTTHNFT